MVKLEIEVTEAVGEELKKLAKSHLLTTEDEAKFALANYAVHMAKRTESKDSLAQFLMSLGPALTHIGQMLKNNKKED